MTSKEFTIRPAHPDDLDRIVELTRPFVESRQLLRRTPEEIAELIPNGFSALDFDGELIGFAAVEIYSKKLAEILCLAVAQQAQGKGVGRCLVDQCIRFAEENNVHELMAISSSDHFLMSCGFHYTLPDQKRALFINPGSATRPPAVEP